MDINVLLHNDIKKGYFVDSIKSTIKPLFQIAYNQGYGLWQEDASDGEIVTTTLISRIPKDTIHTLNQ